MADKMTPQQRSDCMRRIKSKNTRPEMLVRRFLFSHGFRYRIHAKTLPGTPDLAIVGLRTCIFINGCFWHGHNCRNVSPETNRDYWDKKRSNNIKHDNKINDLFEKRGWTVIRIWECELKKKNVIILNKKLEQLKK